MKLMKLFVCKHGLTMLFLLITLSYTQAQENQEPRTHVVTLNVNTLAIQADNADQVSNFGQDSSVSNKDFTVFVRKGDTVVWRARSTSDPQNDEVRVRFIKHTSGVKLFGSETLTDNAENVGVVSGTVSKGRDGDIEKYDVLFVVIRNGEQVGGTHTIDPKLHVKG